MLQRRPLLIAGLAGLAGTARANTIDVSARIRTGAVVVAFRHSLAPGTYDPPGFRLGDCSTQRNLNDEGRAQARRIGAWFRDQALLPAAVRTSPWCRCVDTATLAFGNAEVWPPLGSPRGNEAAPDNVATLREALLAASRQPGRFEVWVSHMFVLNGLLGAATGSGEGLVLQSGADGPPRLLARLNLP